MIIQFSFNTISKKTSTFQLIKSDYKAFCDSKLTLENYFDVEIVLCKMSHHNSSFTTSVTSVHRRPIFVGYRERRNNINYYIISLSDVKCVPIKISVRDLFLIYGIEHNSDPLDVYNKHRVNLIFRKIEVSLNLN